MTRMVDIGEKAIVRRSALAEGRLKLRSETLRAIKAGEVKKGDVLTVSQVAGIEAAKQTSDLLPLCHQIPLSSVEIELELDEESVVARTTVVADYQTGVEMEALIGTAVALLNVWDMVKYLEKDDQGQYPTAEITGLRVLRKEKKEAM